MTQAIFSKRGPSPPVKDIVTQVNLLKLLKRRGSVLKFARQNGEMQCGIVLFCNASHSTDHGQLGFVAGMLFGDLSLDSVFHTMSWSSHKSRRPVKSIGSAEILTSGEAIEEGKVLAKAYSKLLGFEIGLWIVFDSKDLYGTLSTCRNASDRSIRGDVSVIRFDFETKKIERMVWVPGKCNYGDPLTKTDSPMVDALQNLLYSGRISIDFEVALLN
ncbi:hypothetical protein BWQ96_08781 [Gracilariopsis chorda]|uniref:Uncharacterized protein n=1 Tax=Gracilariopsis chorda TaxID=448386 RepID=A0A2V3IHG4_9FLOR|nr:hypothetical protein BWQ96_08781 [Gracilariopsis chorda]|eukprot:PXF41499.1 hypothetical protein BWQ96_08781 [Gracilariopsis chorda]